MSKKLSLFAITVILIGVSIWLIRYNKSQSHMRLVFQNLFPSVDYIANQNNQMTIENRNWIYYGEFKSNINKSTSWVIVKSTPVDQKAVDTTNDNQIKYSILYIKNQQVVAKNMDFLVYQNDPKITFELHQINQNTEGLFFVIKNCETDFCYENLKIISLVPNQISEIGNIILSDSNLSTCKTENKSCYEFTGSYQLEESTFKEAKAIKIFFKGFEEDQNKNSKNIEPEKYILKDGKFISESVLKYH